MADNYLLGSNTIYNSQTVTFNLVQNIPSNTTFTFSMAGWHGGNDWASNFGIYGIISSGTEVKLGEASHTGSSNIYTVTFTTNATYSQFRVRSMKGSGNYQLNWAVLDTGTDVHYTYVEPGVTSLPQEIRRLYVGSDEVVRRYVGSDLVHVVDWEERTREEVIPYTTYYYNDPNRFIGDEVVTQEGVNGIQLYVWTVEVVNNIFTGRKTPESIRSFTPSIRREIARGTKIRQVTVTAYLRATISDSSTEIKVLPLSSAIFGKKIVHIQLEPGVEASGSWYLNTSDPQTHVIPLGGWLMNYFGNIPRHYMYNESIRITYIP